VVRGARGRRGKGEEGEGGGGGTGKSETVLELKGTRDVTHQLR